MNGDPKLAQLILGLRQAGVTDHRVLSAMERVPRDYFVDAGWAEEAYTDKALPIACGQTISQPMIVALMTQALEVGERHKVLEIGTGSGYQAAVLARLARRVYSIERHRDLHLEAERRFRELSLYNVVTRLGDGWKGWPEQGPFDRIMVTAAAPEIPALLLDQLAFGGVMVLPLGGEYETQNVIRIHKTEAGITEETLFPVRFVPMLPGVAPGQRHS